MSPRHTNAASLLALLSAAVLGITGSALLLGQTQTRVPAPAANHGVIVLDPAHGGPDAGAKLGSQVLEKDVTLALAARLRTVLTAAGFTVVSTREADSFRALPNDQRAESANRAHAIACLVIHATGTGSGAHLYVSSLQPKDQPEETGDADGADPSPFEPTPWETAQAAFVTQSLHLQSDLATALGAGKLPVMTGRAALRPLDNLTCPAVAVELAPLAVAGQDTTPVTDKDYQQRLAEATARALTSWRSQLNTVTAPAAAANGEAQAAQTRAAVKAAAAADAAGAAAASGRPQ